MVDKQNDQVVIEHFDGVDDSLLEPMVGAFRKSGILVQLLRYSPGHQGSQGVLALLPTAVQLIVTFGPAVGGGVATVLLHEVAKDMYVALKRGFAALWENLHGTSDPGYSQKFSMKLSVIYEFPNGGRLKLLLNPKSQLQDAETAFDQFHGHVKQKLGAIGPHLHPRDEFVEIWVFDPGLKRLEQFLPDVDRE